jgi:hypothetical protein
LQPAAQISVTRMAVNQASCPGMLQATKSSSLTVRTVLVKRAGQLCDVARGITRPLMPVADRTAVFPTIHSMAHPGIPGMRCVVSARFIWMKVGNMWQPCAVTSNGNDIEAKRSDTSIIGVILVSKRNELTYSRMWKDRSEANTIIIILCRIEAITNIISPEFARSKRKRK